MYYQQFESWGAAVDKATSFVITTTFKIAGDKTGVYTTSPVPITAIGSVIEQIRDALDTKTSWTQWDRNSKEIVVVPYEQIVTIRLSLVD
jgi:hypothetical protein